LVYLKERGKKSKRKYQMEIINRLALEINPMVTGISNSVSDGKE
jgi:hypothetical protein